VIPSAWAAWRMPWATECGIRVVRVVEDLGMVHHWFTGVRLRIMCLPCGTV